jgi:hypothetical protein
MSHNPKENDEDISNLDEVFDDKKVNVDKISKDNGSAVTDSEPSEGNEENGSGQEIVQEKSEPEHKDVGGVDVQGDEEENGVEEGKEEEVSDTTSTSPLLRLLPPPLLLLQTILQIQLMIPPRLL